MLQCELQIAGLLRQFESRPEMRANAVCGAVAFWNETAVFDGERDGEKLFAIMDFRRQTIGRAHDETRLRQQLFATLQLLVSKIYPKFIH